MHKFSVLDVSCSTFAVEANQGFCICRVFYIWTAGLHQLQQHPISHLQLRGKNSLAIKTGVQQCKCQCNMPFNHLAFNVQISWLQIQTRSPPTGTPPTPTPGSARSTYCVNKNKKPVLVLLQRHRRINPMMIYQTNRLKEALQSQVCADWNSSATYRMLNNSRRLPVAAPHAAHADHSLLQHVSKPARPVWHTAFGKQAESPPGACSSKPLGSTDVQRAGVDKDLHLDIFWFSLQSARKQSAFSVAWLFYFHFEWLSVFSDILT